MAKLSLQFTSKERTGDIFDNEGVVFVQIGYTLVPIPKIGGGIDPNLYTVYSDSDGLFIDLGTHYVNVTPLFPDRYSAKPKYNRYVVTKGQFVIVD